jgi:hypothetical protein
VIVVALVRIGSARHQKPQVRAGHQRSPPAHKNRRSHRMHRSGLGRPTSMRPGSSPLLRHPEPERPGRGRVAAGGAARRIGRSIRHGPGTFLYRSTRCSPQPRHSRYQSPYGLRRRCQRWSRSRQRQGLAITASLCMHRAGSVRATRRVQTRDSTPLAWSSCSAGVIPYSCSRTRHEAPGRRGSGRDDPSVSALFRRAGRDWDSTGHHTAEGIWVPVRRDVCIDGRSY